MNGSLLSFRAGGFICKCWARTLCSPSLIYFEVYNNQPWWQLKYNNMHWIGEELVHYMWWYIRDQKYLIWFDMVLTKDFIDHEWKMILLFKQPINYYSIEVYNNEQCGWQLKSIKIFVHWGVKHWCLEGGGCIFSFEKRGISNNTNEMSDMKRKGIKYTCKRSEMGKKKEKEITEENEK